MRKWLIVPAGLLAVAVGFWCWQKANAPEDRVGNAGEKVAKSDAEWRKLLTEEEYYVTRRKGTERAFTGRYANHKGDGVYRCVCCDLLLFDSETKYESGTGW